MLKRPVRFCRGLRGVGPHFLPLDTCIEMMRQTGLDMIQRYKEPSTGFIAVTLPTCPVFRIGHPVHRAASTDAV